MIVGQRDSEAGEVDKGKGLHDSRRRAEERKVGDKKSRDSSEKNDSRRRAEERKVGDKKSRDSSEKREQ